MGNVSKELFEKFAQKTQEELNTNNSSGSYAFEGEDLKWTSPDRNKKKVWKVLRLIGNPPASIIPNDNPQPEDPLEFQFAEIKDDKGKGMKLRLPVADGTSNSRHLIQRIVDRVMEKEYVVVPGQDKKKKVYVNENSANPAKKAAFEMVAKSGWTLGDSKYSFARDWSGQRVVVFNCIDRDMIDWHRQNKHTALLAKNIGVSVKEDGTEIEWPATGMPSFGFVSKLLDLVKTYNSKGKGNGWEGFDIGLYRTGTTENPNIIYNVSAFKKKDFLDEIEGKVDIDKICVDDDLSDEEKSWERYDIQKLFAPTSYTKIMNRMGYQIKQIDAAFGTFYYDELKDLAAKEAAEREAKKAEEIAAAPTVEVQSETLQESTLADETPVADVPVRRSVAKEDDASSDVDTSLLLGWDYLSDEEKSKIIKTEKNPDGSLKTIVYADDVGALSQCDCGIVVPYAFANCAKCGAHFED